MHLRCTIPLKLVEPSSPVGMKAGLCSVLLKSGFPVPDGFCITARTYRKFIQENGIESTILDMYHQSDLTDVESIKNLSADVAKLIMDSPMPENMSSELSRMYKSIYLAEGMPPEAAGFFGSNREQTRVIVRPSVQDKHSFAGVFASHEAHGSKSLVEAVKAVWASLHSSKAIIYRTKLRINHDMDMAVLVQKGLDFEKSGTAITGASTLIESVPGHCHLFLHGEIEADMHIVQSNILTGKRIIPKTQMLSRDKAGNFEVVNCSMEDAVLSDNEVFKISSLSQSIHEKFGFPQILEWGIVGNKIYILQTRSHTFNIEIGEGKGGVANGLPVSRGYTSGVLTSEFPDKLDSKILLVCTKQTVASVLVSAGVIAENGGYGSHSALLARELETPAIFSAKGAMNLNGKKVALDGFEGAVFLTESLKVSPESFKVTKVAVKEEPKPLVEEEYVMTESESREPVVEQPMKTGVWIDTPADALNAHEIVNDAAVVFIDVAKMAKLALGRDFSMDKLNHKSVLSLVRTVAEYGKPVHFFWRAKPRADILKAFEEYGTNVFFPAKRD